MLVRAREARFDPDSFDAVGIQVIAPNPGKRKPLGKNVKLPGGELSENSSGAEKRPYRWRRDRKTLIFDEIDTGIGGEVAVAVSKYLKASPNVGRFCKIPILPA